jgi:hypothetical protein
VLSKNETFIPGSLLDKPFELETPQIQSLQESLKEAPLSFFFYFILLID